jgi:DNA-binding transcriptional MocR family regulator
MSSVLAVTPGDPTPPYEQLRRQLVDLIEGGQFVEGERLPPLQQLTGDLGLAVGTVVRTYHELEAAGLVRSDVAAGPGWLLGQRPCRRGSGLGTWTSSRSPSRRGSKPSAPARKRSTRPFSRPLV